MSKPEAVTAEGIAAAIQLTVSTTEAELQGRIHALETALSVLIQLTNKQAVIMHYLKWKIDQGVPPVPDVSSAYTRKPVMGESYVSGLESLRNLLTAMESEDSKTHRELIEFFDMICSLEDDASEQ